MRAPGRPSSTRASRPWALRPLPSREPREKFGREPALRQKRPCASAFREEGALPPGCPSPARGHTGLFCRGKKNTEPPETWVSMPGETSRAVGGGEAAAAHLTLQTSPAAGWPLERPALQMQGERWSAPISIRSPEAKPPSVSDFHPSPLWAGGRGCWDLEALDRAWSPGTPPSKETSLKGCPLRPHPF